MYLFLSVILGYPQNKKPGTESLSNFLKRTLKIGPQEVTTCPFLSYPIEERTRSYIAESRCKKGRQMLLRDSSAVGDDRDELG